ncbi:MAG: UDP-N-acetylmuramoyl-L-alanine--D-glutamate ligase, partial [Planctomycetota bacterium]
MSRAEAGAGFAPPDRSPEELSGLRVLILGLGRFGGGGGAAHFFASHGAVVTITDLRSEAELAPSLEPLRELPIARLRLGEHREEDLEGADWVVVNPAVKPRSRALEIASRAGTRLVTEIGLFLSWCRSRFVAGITGSNGKSTTAKLLAEMLGESGLRARLGGNIGASLLGELREITVEDRVVLELSSFQLARLGMRTPRPQAVAITQFSPNHLDWHGDEEAYRLAKEEILVPSATGQDGAMSGDHDGARACARVAALPAGDPHLDAWRRRAAGRVVVPFGSGPPSGPAPGVQGAQGVAAAVGYRDGWLVTRAGAEEIPIADSGGFPLRGDANRGNIACATALALALGARRQGIARAIAAARPLPHRQEIVAGAQGITFVNDSKATTVEAACTALEALGPRVVLLAGGSSKGSTFEALAGAACRAARAVALYGETAAALEGSLLEAGFPPRRLRRVADLGAAFAWAIEVASPGDTILLS